MNRVGKILIAVDLSASSQAAMQWAFSLAEQLGGPSMDILYVAELPSFRADPLVSSTAGATPLRDFALEEARSELDAFLRDVPAEQRGKLKLHIDAGRPRDRILARAGAYDLLVMGTHGRTGRVHALAGSVAESVVRMAPCPVVTVRES
jgi:universal stress protein A